MKSTAMWLLALALSACDASSAPDATDLADAADPPDSGDDAQAPLADGGSAGDLTPRTVSGTFTLTLDAGAFAPTAAHPSALVYLPSGFRPTAPLSLIVYLHGFSNCVENIVRDAGQPCTPGGGVRSAYALAAQLEASGKNAMLLCPEAAFDQATGNPGNLGAAGGLRALVQETLADLQPQLAPLTVADVGTVIVASHSGGYQAAGAIAARGGLPVSEIFLLDSLYDGTLFDAWVKSDLTSLAGTAPAHRFADVYLSGGTTATNSVAMANRARDLGSARRRHPARRPHHRDLHRRRLSPWTGLQGLGAGARCHPALLLRRAGLDQSAARQVAALGSDP